MAKRLTMAQSIKAFCIACQGQEKGQSLDAVRDCAAKPGTQCECALYPYRLGKNPALVGKRGGRAKSAGKNAADANLVSTAEMKING